MRRKILIFLGLLVALLPYLGFPYDYNKWVWTTAGFLIVFLVLLPRTPKTRRLDERFDTMSRSSRISQEDGGESEPQRSLHVERRETEDRGGVRIEREAIVDTKHIEESLPPVSPDTIDTVVERKVSVVRRRKKAGSTPPPTFSDYGSGNT